MLAKLKSSWWLIVFAALPQAISARSPVPLAFIIGALLVFILVWLATVNSKLKADPTTEPMAMGTDRTGLIILAAMGAAFVFLKLAMIYGGFSGYMIAMSGLLVAMVLALLIASIIGVSRRKSHRELKRSTIEKSRAYHSSR